MKKQTFETKQSVEKVEKPGGYIPFDPEKELVKIRELTSEEQKLNPKKRIEIKKERFVRFKKELIGQRKEIIRLEKDLIERIRGNPDITKDGLWDLVEKRKAEGRFSQEQIEELKRVIDIYIERHQGVEKFKKEHTNEELFKLVFGRPPKGKIEVLTGPMVLYFRCHNSMDFIYAWYGRDKRDAAEIVGTNAFYRPCLRFGAPVELEETVIVENTAHLYEKAFSLRDPVLRKSELTKEQQKVYLHEEQHSFQNLFDTEEPLPNASLKLFNKEEPSLIISQVRHLNRKESNQVMEKFFRGKRRIYEVRAKQEMLAFYKEGLPFKKIWDTLMNDPGYKFFRKDKYYILKPLLRQLGQERKEDIRKIMLETLGREYGTRLAQALNAIEDLEKAGFHQDEIIALFHTEPLGFWPKWARRLTAGARHCL